VLFNSALCLLLHWNFWILAGTGIIHFIVALLTLEFMGFWVGQIIHTNNLTTSHDEGKVYCLVLVYCHAL